MKRKPKQRKEQSLPPPTEWLRQLENKVWGSKGPHRSHLSGKHGRYTTRHFYLPPELMSRVVVGNSVAYTNSNEGNETDASEKNKGTPNIS